MKKTIFLLTGLVFLLSAQSCKDFLTPELKTDLPLTTFGNTPAEANLLLNQAYSELRNDNVTGSIFWSIFTTDYSVPPAGTTLARSNVARLSYDATDVDVYTIWQAHYTALSRPNIVIDKAVTNLARTDLSAGDQASWKMILAEARFLRAFSYFNLVRLFRNVPIIDKPLATFDDIAAVGNGTVMKDQENKVYDFILSDLTQAVDALPETADRGRATKYAALTMLGKVYLNRATIEKFRDQTGDGRANYDNALKALNQVIASGRYALKTYFPDNFIRDKQFTGNNEFVFTLEFNELDNNGTRVGQNMGYINNSTSTVDLGTLAGANGGSQATDFGWSVFDVNSPGDIVRRFWTFEEGEFQRYDVNGDKVLQITAADCPNGGNCEILLRTSEPYPFTRPYWYEVIADANAFRSTPVAADVLTLPNGKTAFSTVWSSGNLNSNAGERLVKYRRNPLTQANYTVNTWDADLPVFRYAEVLLMYAEAANEIGGPGVVPAGGTLTPLAAVNLIRDRARNFVYYPSLTTASRIIETGPYKTTYGDVFSRVAKVGTNPAKTDNAADTLAKYYNQISAFRGLRETPPSPVIRNFKDFTATANFVPDFPSSLSQTDFRNELLDERWRELAGEQNNRWYDLTRYGLLVKRVQQYQTLVNPLTKRSLASTPFGQSVLPSPDKKFEYLPIPNSEISRNAKLFQNTGF